MLYPPRRFDMTRTKTFAAALVATVTFAASGGAFAHGMGGHMGSQEPHGGTVMTNKTTNIIEHHDRFRHRRFFAFGYVAPDSACVWKRTVHGLVKICPVVDWY
jgi:hypothetical protein